MSKKKTSKRSFTGSRLTVIAIFLLVIVALGAVIGAVGNSSTEYESFYVDYDGVTLNSERMQIDFPVDKDLRFDVGYTFSNFLVKKNLGYNVRIVPNKLAYDFDISGAFGSVEDDFEVLPDVGIGVVGPSAGGVQHFAFQDCGDLSSLFDVKVYDDYFTFCIPSDLTIEKLFGKLLPLSSVVVSGYDPLEYYFSLEISSYDNLCVYQIDFRLAGAGLFLDSSEVLF